MGSLEKKVALVTGASRGIGAAIAQRFAAEGATVVCAARSADDAGDHLPGSLTATIAAIASSGGTAVAFPCDVGDAAARHRLVDQTFDRFGRIDILVNNAAVAFAHPFEAVAGDQFTRQIDVNLRAPFEFCQRVVPAMRDRGEGWIVNISGRVAALPLGPPFNPVLASAGLMVYGITKAALDRFTAGLAAELYGTGIAVNGVAPHATVPTPGVKASNFDRSGPQWREEPVEVMAEAALALAVVDPASFTGHTVLSAAYLEQIGRPVLTLDGRSPLPG